MLACAGMVDGRQTVTVNATSSAWSDCSTHKRWKLWIGILLHEATHAIFQISDFHPLPCLGGHYAAWHMVSKAVETRMLSELGVITDLGRDCSLLKEYTSFPTTDLLVNELQYCFEGRFSFCHDPLNPPLGAFFDHTPKPTNSATIPHNYNLRALEERAAIDHQFCHDVFDDIMRDNVPLGLSQADRQRLAQHEKCIAARNLWFDLVARMRSPEYQIHA
jgi:hypothetical protein